jgi:hypothetical protein
MGTDENGLRQPPFEFDTVISEDTTSELDIMDNPVETGFIVSDHVVLMPKVIEMYAVVSEIWLGMRQSDRDRVLELARDYDWLVPAAGGDTLSRHARALQNMLNLQASGNPFSYQTGLGLRESLLLKKLGATQDKRTGGALLFRATLREVRIVSTRTVKYTPRADKATARKADPKTTSGAKQAPEQTVAKRKSVFLRGGQATGVL